MGDVLGVHLLQTMDLVGSPRRSAVTRVDAGGALVALDLAAGDDEILGLVGAVDVPTLAVDAPLAVPEQGGRRDAEAVLAWCDITAFPVSRRRLAQVHGGARGIDLAPGLAAPGRRLCEALPDQVLRQIAWERDHPPGSAPLELGDYRTRWLGVRAPAYRPKLTGRARRPGLAQAHALLAGVLDLGGWAPAPGGDDWSAIADAARLDALCCAYAALRLARGGAMVVGVPGRGEIAVPVDANLAHRLQATLERMRGEGTIAI